MELIHQSSRISSLLQSNVGTFALNPGRAYRAGLGSSAASLLLRYKGSLAGTLRNLGVSSGHESAAVVASPCWQAAVHAVKGILKLPMQSGATWGRSCRSQQNFESVLKPCKVSCRLPHLVNSPPYMRGISTGRSTGMAVSATASIMAVAGMRGFSRQLRWTASYQHLQHGFSRQLHWNQSHQYLQYVNRCMAESVSPYWQAVQWSTLQVLMHRASQWLPSLPGVAHFHVPVLSALNLVGMHLPRTLAILMVESMRSNREARAQSFESYAGSAEAEALAEAMASQRAWWRMAAEECVTAAWHIVRLMWLLLVFAPVVLTAPLVLHWGVCRPEWMALLRRTLETAGAFFIKWGQWAATRHDIFPPDMCKALAMLHTQHPNRSEEAAIISWLECVRLSYGNDMPKARPTDLQAPAHGFRQTKRVVEEAFGMRMDEIFESIEEAPVASGSIGQIHRATLSAKGAAITGCEPGQVVAVKVRHPGTAATILHDFETMLWVAHLARGLPAVQSLRLEDTLKQFAAPLKEQVDLAREASNLQRFNYNFRRTDHVRFPVPLYPLVSADVLVESFEEGNHITDYIESHNNPYNHRLSELGSGTMLQMMLVDNLIHSDLHPGNILVRLNPPTGLLGLCYRALDKVQASSKVSSATRARIHNTLQCWLQPQIVLLDVGMATEMNDEDQVNMVGLFMSFAKMDGKTCGDWVLKFSGPQQSCPDPESFKADMQRTFDILKRAEEAVSEDALFHNSAEALASVLELIRQHQVSLPGHICAVVVTTLVLEGWSNKLDPDHSVLMQVQKMFEGVNIPWRERMLHVVDNVMQDEEQHTSLV